MLTLEIQQFSEIKLSIHMILIYLIWMKQFYF